MRLKKGEFNERVAQFSDLVHKYLMYEAKNGDTIESTMLEAALHMNMGYETARRYMQLTIKTSDSLQVWKRGTYKYVIYRHELSGPAAYARTLQKSMVQEPDIVEALRTTYDLDDTQIEHALIDAKEEQKVDQMIRTDTSMMDRKRKRWRR